MKRCIHLSAHQQWWQHWAVLLLQQHWWARLMVHQCRTRLNHTSLLTASKGGHDIITSVSDYLVGNISGAALSQGNPVIQNALTDGWNGISSASSWTDLQNTIMVDMLGDALWIINVRGQNCSIGHGMEGMTSEAVQSLLLWVQQLEASSAENVVLCQRITDLEMQAH